MKWTSLGRGGTLAGVQREEHLLQSGNTRTGSTLVFQYADLIQFQNGHANISFLECIDCSHRCEDKGGYSKVYQ